MASNVKHPLEDLDVSEIVVSICSFGIYPILVAFRQIIENHKEFENNE